MHYDSQGSMSALHSLDSLPCPESVQAASPALTKEGRGAGGGGGAGGGER